MPLELKNKTPVQSNQDAFDRAWDRLVNNFKLGTCVSEEKFPTCTYRKWNDQGELINTCVVGWMLPDDVDWTQPVKNEEGSIQQLVQLGVEPLMAHEPRLGAWLSGARIELLDTLQGVHDNGAYRSLASMKQRLREVAEEFELVAPV